MGMHTPPNPILLRTLPRYCTPHICLHPPTPTTTPPLVQNWVPWVLLVAKEARKCPLPEDYVPSGHLGSCTK